MIKVQQSQALTSYFESFWSIVLSGNIEFDFCLVVSCPHLTWKNFAKCAIIWISVGKMVIEVMKNPLFGVLTTVYEEKEVGLAGIGILQAYFYGKSDKWRSNKVFSCKIGLDYLKTFLEKPIFSFFFTFASKVFL